MLDSSIWALTQGSLQVKPTFKITPCFFIPVLSAVKFAVSCQPLSYIPVIFFCFYFLIKGVWKCHNLFLCVKGEIKLPKKGKNYRLGINQEIITKPFLKKVKLSKFSYQAKISSSNATNKFDTTSSHHTSYCSLAAHEGKLKLSNWPFLLFYSSYYLFSCQNSIPFSNQ